MDNPFEILDIHAGVGKGEILAAVARAMRERKRPLQQIARAQKMLLDPVSFAAHAFVHCIETSSQVDHYLLPSSGSQRSGRRPERTKDHGKALLVRLTLFDPP